VAHRFVQAFPDEYIWPWKHGFLRTLIRLKQGQSKGGDGYEAGTLRCTQGVGKDNHPSQKTQVHQAEVMPMFQVWTGALQSDSRVKTHGHALFRLAVEI